MKNKIIVRYAILVLLGGAFLQGCAFLAAPIPTASFTPLSTFTPVPTFTATRTATPAPTDTPPPTDTPTRQPTPACGIADGSWASREKTSFFGASTPLLTFRVGGCEITNIEITAYPAAGELFWSPFDGLHAPIQNKAFTIPLENPGGEGTFTVDGKFVSEKSCQGTVKFPKGFLVFDYVLPGAVTLVWNAAPG